MCPSLERNSTADLQQWDYMHHLSQISITCKPHDLELKLGSHASHMIQVCKSYATHPWRHVAHVNLCIYECTQKSLAGSKLILASYSMSHLGNLFILARSASSCCQSDNTLSVLSCICIPAWYISICNLKTHNHHKS